MTKQEETELRNVLVGSIRVSRRMIQILEKNDLICTKGKTHYKIRRRDGKGYIYCFAATPANDIQMLETKRNGIKATVAAAKTQEKMNKISSGSKRSIASLETFDRMEDKANRMLDSAMAEAELSADMDAENDLVNKYVSGGSSSTVDDELAAMKTKLGIL